MKKLLVILAALPWLMAASVCVEVPEWKFVDNDGAIVGDRVFTVGAVHATALVDLGNNLWGHLAVTPDHIRSAWGDTHYTTLDCLGVAYVEHSATRNDLLPLAGSRFAVGSGDKVYLGNGTVLLNQTYPSRWRQGACQNISETIDSELAVELADFDPPYSLLFE